MSKKLVVTLDIKYEPRITEITFPYMRQYTKNIGADFQVINNRKYDEIYPVSLEKMQLYDISEQYDWIIFFDADLLINPDCFDLTETIDSDTILVPEHLDPSDQFKHKNILGKYTMSWHCPLFISVFSKQCRCAFEWPEVDPLQLVRYINPENINGVHHGSKWFLDDFTYNLNLAKYKIPTASIKESFSGYNIAAHIAAPTERKIEFLQNSARMLHQ